MKKLLTLTALLESGTGIGLLIIPSVVTTIILGSPVDTNVALVLTRITGIALLVIGIICWINRNGESKKSAKGLVGANQLIQLWCYCGHWSCRFESRSYRCWTVANSNSTRSYGFLVYYNPIEKSTSVMHASEVEKAFMI
jgi:hypothetical protein